MLYAAMRALGSLPSVALSSRMADGSYCNALSAPSGKGKDLQGKSEMEK